MTKHFSHDFLATNSETRKQKMVKTQSKKKSKPDGTNQNVTQTQKVKTTNITVNEPKRNKEISNRTPLQHQKENM